jgi:hypothetical protein
MTVNWTDGYITTQSSNWLMYWYIKNVCLKHLLEQSDLVLQYHYILLPSNPSDLTQNSEMFTQLCNSFRMPWMKYNFQILTTTLLYNMVILLLAHNMNEIDYFQMIKSHLSYWYYILWLNDCFALSMIKII